MGCMFCSWWRHWFPLTDTPSHDCFYERCAKETTT